MELLICNVYSFWSFIQNDLRGIYPTSEAEERRQAGSASGYHVEITVEQTNTQPCLNICEAILTTGPSKM